VPGTGRDGLFSTHPDTVNRIAALEQIAERMALPARRSAVPPTRPRAASALDPLRRRD
jgi:predicted Zn-dependent protease